MSKREAGSGKLHAMILGSMAQPSPSYAIVPTVRGFMKVFFVICSLQVLLFVALFDLAGVQSAP